MLMLGSHLVKHSSTSQTTVALSSGESEYYAMLKGSTHALGLQSMLYDFGVRSLDKPKLYSDSVAAEGIATRQGLGAVRHIDTRFLWLQDQIKAGRLEIQHVPGVQNPADVFTKALDMTQMRRHFDRMGFEISGEGSRLHRSLE